MGAEVLNGTVETGDRIAYGVRDGNSGGLRVGTVIEVTPYASKRWNYEGGGGYIPCTRHRLRVEVELSSRGTPQKSVILENLDRVAKLS